MPKLAISKLLNIKLFRDDPKLFKFMQVHESGEDQDVSLTKEAKRILSLLRTRDLKKKIRKWKVFQPSLSHSRHKYVQHKNVNMSWDYWKFPRHPVAA